MAFLLAMYSRAKADHPPATNPTIDLLNPQITFYLSFDNESLNADMAEGSPIPLKIDGKPKFVPGKFGKALVLGAGGEGADAYYPTFNNVNFGTPGALSFWISALNWIQKGQATARGYMNFFMSSGARGGNVIIERQGFDETGGKLLRTDNFIAGFFNFPDMKNACFAGVDTLNWQANQWHLIAMNWDRAGFAISVDGGQFSRFEFSRPLTEQDFPPDFKNSSFLLGGGDRETTLLDEFTFYRRPLDEAEIKKMFEAQSVR